MSEEIVQEEEVLEEEVEETTEPEAEESAEEIDWEARAKRAEALIIKNKKESKPEPTKPTPDTEEDEVPEWGKQILESDKKRNFGYEHNLSPETVDELYKYGGGELSAELLESPAAKGIVKAVEGARKNAANTPKGGSTPTYKGKTYAETATNPEATAEEKQAAFDATAKARGLK